MNRVTDLRPTLTLSEQRLSQLVFCRLVCFDYVCLLVCITSDVRQQLSEQLRCLDARLDGHVTLLGDLHDFYRRRSEVELEYSRSMDKLVRQVASRHKPERHRLYLLLLLLLFLVSSVV